MAIHGSRLLFILVVSVGPRRSRVLARGIHELRLMNKDQSRELARALERSQQLEVSLQASNRAHSDFQRLAERWRAELEQAYLGAMDREVSVANQVLVQESQLQAHQASEVLEQKDCRSNLPGAGSYGRHGCFCRPKTRHSGTREPAASASCATCGLSSALQKCREIWELPGARVPP